MENQDIIIVDDNSDICALLENRFLAKDLGAVSASGGDRAVELVQESRDSGHVPIVCLLDVVMPGLSGVPLMKKIKQYAPKIKFILMTGYYGIDDIKNMEQEGCVDIVYKPFKVEEIIAKLNFVLSNTKRIPINAG